MNCSLLTADATTHAKIVVIALLAGIVVMWIGIGTQLRSGKPLSAAPQFEMQFPHIPAKAPVRVNSEIA